jgi:hypothetical protein
MSTAPIMIPARSEANRRNARKSSGPRTLWGKAPSWLNSRRILISSCIEQDGSPAASAYLCCAVDRTARAIVTHGQVAHPCFAKLPTYSASQGIALAEKLQQQIARTCPNADLPYDRKRTPFHATSEAGMLLKTKEVENSLARHSLRQFAPCASRGRNSFSKLQSKPECY